MTTLIRSPRPGLYVCYCQQSTFSIYSHHYSFANTCLARIYHLKELSTTPEHAKTVSSLSYLNNPLGTNIYPIIRPSFRQNGFRG
jgi:hypothetical protein